MVLPNWVSDVFLFSIGLERRLLATVRWTVATAVAFPQKSESTRGAKNPECVGVRDFTFLLLAKSRICAFWKVTGNREYGRSIADLSLLCYHKLEVVIL